MPGDLFNQLAEASRDSEKALTVRQGGAMTGGVAHNAVEKTYVRRAVITGAPVRPVPPASGDLWAAADDMPWIYPAAFSTGKWRSGSGYGDGATSGIWLDPAIPTRYSPDVPASFGVWSDVGRYTSGQELYVVQRGRHWEALAAGGAGTEAVLVRTTGAPTAGSYPVDLYVNGKNEPSTGSGVAEILGMSIGESLPSGTWAMAHYSYVNYLGSDPGA